MAIQSLQFHNGSVSLGDVFVSSWGYEQTNTCFYQVIALRGKKKLPYCAASLRSR
ncbi:hypothetical protein ACNFZG_26705 (plasmid) [Klebsiella pneumoniae]|uniref:hypothetical protein n=1 Tax=Klebsiella pneumoniae TaxID=573 RepID=UPI003D09123B